MDAVNIQIIIKQLALYCYENGTTLSFEPEEGETKYDCVNETQVVVDSAPGGGTRNSTLD